MLGEIIPVIDAIRANKNLKEKIENQDVEVPEKIGEIDIKCLEEDYQNAIDTKNRFEDKAKTIVAALTISITLILNLSKIIDTISDKYRMQIINILIFALALLAIIYMLVAGIMSVQVLIKENVLYPISLKERSKKDKSSFYKKTQLNIKQNLIRNNIIYASYQSIRNSAICLVIIFILAILPYQNSNKSNVVYERENTNVNICYSLDAMNWLMENNRDISFAKLIDAYAKDNENTTTKNIYDKENQIIVTIKKVDNLYVIDDIISPIEEIE